MEPHFRRIFVLEYHHRSSASQLKIEYANGITRRPDLIAAINSGCAMQSYPQRGEPFGIDYRVTWN